jgi:uncharacterized phage protein (TIGR01671 family)
VEVVLVVNIVDGKGGDDNEGGDIGFSINGYEIHKSDMVINLYTGFNDMKGKMIYEGDILQTLTLIGVVKWDDYFGCWRVVDLDKVFNPALTYSRAKESNIIGNIFENPELLGGNDNV